MTFNELKEILLDEAPDDVKRREAKQAMLHYSYTSYSFRITNGLRNMRMADVDAEEFIANLAHLFYKSDLIRFRRTGSFDSRVVLEEEPEGSEFNAG